MYVSIDMCESEGEAGQLKAVNINIVINDDRRELLQLFSLSAELCYTLSWPILLWNVHQPDGVSHNDLVVSCASGGDKHKVAA